MFPYVYIIPFLAIFVAVLVTSELKKVKKGTYATKPVATLLVILTALLSFKVPETTRQYTLLIVIGLVFCFGGDMALMFMESKKAFLIGLVLFLLGHVVYAVTFLIYGGDSSHLLLTALVLFVIGVFIYAFLYPGLGKMKVPVAFYILIISAMVAAAAASLFSASVPKTVAWLITIGSVLFWVSDIVLGVNRFRIPLKYDRLSLIAYYSGQFLIAVSTYYFVS
ncbi:MAG: lysoplasmalogenase [Deltaproteobacteria bacterium]|uniref:Lysoplasmalogenase n=1 Tax=Candidatus Zymogenus saltonus TaxID=2844893 RepID=A0A9D8KG15_9DELT|nr:lysoplasmalogenase [Candidatus Zymogenus saltonus]